jgi:hypothetical protein
MVELELGSEKLLEVSYEVWFASQMSLELCAEPAHSQATRL